MKTFKQFTENAFSDLERIREREQLKKERMKELEDIKKEIVQDVVKKVSRKTNTSVQ